MTSYRFVPDDWHPGWGAVYILQDFRLFGFKVFSYWELLYKFVQYKDYDRLTQEHSDGMAGKYSRTL